MPNIATVLREEIIRLARKELRTEIEGLKKASSTSRSEIVALKRRVEMLEKQVARLNKKTAPQEMGIEAPEASVQVRFSAESLAKHRQRLGLTAANLGTLLGVSAQTVYNWEAGKAKPRQQQLAGIASLRRMGKRQAKAKLVEE